MPTVLTINGLRFHFYSNDHRPIHIHVQHGKGGPTAKIELEPMIRVLEVNGFSKGDMRKIVKLIAEAQDDLIRSWKDYFDE